MLLSNYNKGFLLKGRLDIKSDVIIYFMIFPFYIKVHIKSGNYMDCQHKLLSEHCF